MAVMFQHRYSDSMDRSGHGSRAPGRSRRAPGAAGTATRDGPCRRRAGGHRTVRPGAAAMAGVRRIAWRCVLVLGLVSVAACDGPAGLAGENGTGPVAAASAGSGADSGARAPARHYPPRSSAQTVLDGTSTLHHVPLVAPDVPAHSEIYGYASRRVQIAPGVELFVIDEGTGTPLVLLNGGPGNSLQSFLPHFRADTVDARLIMYDPRGVGRSSWHPGPDGYSTSQAVDDLERLRARLGVGRWVLLGWSWGGIIAQRYLLAYPDRVLGLVLVSSSETMGLERDDDHYMDNLTPEERSRLRAVYSLSGTRVVPVHSDGLDRNAVRQLVYNGYMNGDWKRQFFYRPSDERMAHIAEHEWHHDRNYNPLMRETGLQPSLGGRFLGIDIPVLMVYGVWDMTFSREMPARFATEFRDVQLHVLGRSSHHPFASEPEVFFPILNAWLAENVGTH